MSISEKKIDKSLITLETSDLNWIRKKGESSLSLSNMLVSALQHKLEELKEKVSYRNTGILSSVG